MSVFVILSVGLVVLFLWPRWWLLALLGVGCAYVVKWPVIAENAEDLIFYMPPMIAWLSMPVFVLVGLVVVTARKWLTARGSAR